MDARSEHIERLKEGVQKWNQWRKDVQYLRPNLSNATLTGHNLAGYDLARVDLIESDLRRANLRRARTHGANFYKADLSGTELVETDASLTSFVYAKFERADLSRVDLTSSDLRCANLTRARLGWAKLCDVDFSSAVGLDSVEHRAASSLAIDTIVRSIPRLPLSFLQGVGVPKVLIDAIAELAATGHCYKSCFISHSSRDREFVERIVSGFKNEGVRCYYATHDITARNELLGEIEGAIRTHDRLLVVLSEHSLANEWVKKEMAIACTPRSEGTCTRVLPVTLLPTEKIKQWQCQDLDGRMDLAAEVRKYHIHDFSNWSEAASYKSEFNRLLKSLRVETSHRKPFSKRAK